MYNSECGRFLYRLLISQGLIYLYRFHNYSAQDWLFEEQRNENNENKQIIIFFHCPILRFNYV